MKHLFKVSLLSFILVILLQTAAYSGVIRVKPGGNDASSGADWSQDKKTVQAAINVANDGDEIWVAAGTYAEHSKNKTVGPQGSEVAVNVALYGGFAGTETARDQRNWSTNLTILTAEVIHPLRLTGLSSSSIPAPPRQPASMVL